MPRAYTCTLMHWLKPLALIVALAVVVHANCAVSCLHPLEQPLPAGDHQSSKDCHHSNTPDKSEGDGTGDACSHSLISGSTSSPATKICKPALLVLAAEDVTLPLEPLRVSFVTEFNGFNSFSFAPPITVLRI